MTYFWDKKGKYSEGNLKDYKYWMTTVSYRQHTLGAFIIFCKREGVERISELTTDELIELKEIMNLMENIMKDISEFNPDRFNYLQLGNKWHNLHFHCVPRYKDTRVFAGTEWIDKTYGSPPIWKDNEEDISVIKAVKELFLKYL